MTDTALSTKTTGLDREAKQKIRNWVLRLRHAFEDDIRTQLKRYGIEAGKSMAKDAPDYLTSEEKKARRIIVAAIRRDAQHERSGEDALTAYVRECAYTLLNRLVGLKCMEARDILLIEGVQNEIITTRSEYGDRSRLLWQMRDKDREDRNDETRLWRNGLLRAFRAVTLDIALLFDPDSEWSQVWPTQKTLREAIRDINGLDAACHSDGQASVYASPDFLGWVYQFFNAEEKEEIRAETGGKPRTSHELAVINQFYTPDWIVKFLVDNTLGRVWLRMHPDSRLRDRISYLVPNTGEDESAPFKQVRDLKLLDPACGTMHMGQYAYGLFYEMYLEEREKVGSAGWPHEPSVHSSDAIPAAILSNNLHGIDIDPRAIQIAALTLLLTMKEQARAHGLNPKDVRVERMNLVCADAVNLGAAEMEEFFLELAQSPQIYGGTEGLRRVVKAVWEGLNHVTELGSLVQVGEEVERALQTMMPNRQLLYEPTQTSMAEALDVFTPQLPLTEEQRATAREQLEDALADYARKNLGAEDINRRLFAQETGKAIHLLDLLRQKYDAVVMNPPYGEFIENVKVFIGKAYPRTKNDIYAAFIERGTQLLERTGHLGALTSRTFLNLGSFTPLREEILLKECFPIAMLDLGFNVLDGAVVETAATVLSPQKSVQVCSFFRLNKYEEDRESIFAQSIRTDKNSTRYDIRLTEFTAMPNATIAYWASDTLRRNYAEMPALDPLLAKVRVGLQTSDDKRFARQWWEVDGELIGPTKKWVRFANGGDYSKFYSDVDQIVDWSDEAKACIAKMGRPQNSGFYFLEGLSYSYITVKGFNVHHLPANCIFGVAGSSVFPAQGQSMFLLGVLNSSLIQFFLWMIMDSRKYQVGVVQKIPICNRVSDNIADLAEQAHKYKYAWDNGNEVSTHFIKPWVVQSIEQGLPWQTLGDLLNGCLTWERTNSADGQRLQNEIDVAVCDLYEISSQDRALIKHELGVRPPETVWPQMEGKNDDQKRLEHVCRLLSYLVKISVDGDNDGIIPLVPCGSDPTLMERVHDHLERLFGAERVGTAESEINNLFGKRVTIDTWLAKSYFKFHLGLYKKRPIYWHITSEDGGFGAIVHYHRFTYDRLAKLRSAYLYDFLQRLLSEIGGLRGDQSGAARDRLAKLEANLESARALDEQLRQIQEGEIPIRVPWKSDSDQPKGWRPDIDDGVKVNIGPFEKAGVLAVKKIV